MSVTHTVAARNTLANAIAALVDAGAGPGKLVFMTSGNVAVATMTFSDPSFGAAVGGAITANAILSDPSAVGGVAAIAKVTDSNGLEVFRCSVTNVGGGGDITINSVTVSPTQQVTTTSLTYAAPP